MEKTNTSKEETGKSNDNKLLKRNSSKKKQLMEQTLLDEFIDRLKLHTVDIFDEQYKNLVKQMYFLEEKWSHLIGDEYMNARMKKQQESLWEFLSTERNYICRMRVIVEVFQQVFRIAQREGDLLDFNSKEIFANINQVLLTNDTIWRDYLVKVLNKTRKKKRPIKPSELLAAFTKTEELYKSYVEFCMLQDACLKRIREYSNGHRENSKKARFKVYLDFCEELVQSERYKLVDLMTEPMQRVTRYPLLLKSILENTENPQEKKQLQNMIKIFEEFLVKINSRLRRVHEKEKLEKILEEFEEFNTWTAGNEEVIWGCVDFLRSEVSKIKEPRCLLEKGTVKLIDKKGKSEMNVEMLLFTDVIVFTRRRSSTKKLVVTKQMHFLDRVKFIKSEISSTSIVVLYLDEHGMLANAMMLEMGEKDRDKWMEDVSKAQDRYERAKAGCGSTLEFFQDNKGASDENMNAILPPRKTSDLVKSVEVTRRPSVESRKAIGGGDTAILRNASNKSLQTPEESKETFVPISRNTSFKSFQTIEDNKDDVFENGESGLDRRSASWLLTDEKKVHSIRSLLREDLWGNYVKVKPSFSFRSEVSDSGISLGESFSSRKSDDSPVSCHRIRNSDSDDNSKDSSTLVRSNSNPKYSDLFSLTSNKGTGSVKAENSQPCSAGSTQTLEKHPMRKISSTSSSLPGISENVYSEVTFSSSSEVKDKQQRRLIKATPLNDYNNNKDKACIQSYQPFTNDNPVDSSATKNEKLCKEDKHTNEKVLFISNELDNETKSLPDTNYDTAESYLENI